MAVAFTMMLAIAACGGGGGGGGGFKGDSGGSGNGSDTYFLQVALKDADGNDTSIVSSTSPGTLQVFVTRNGKKGPAVPDVIVLASTDSGLLFPSSGSKLTNSDGFVTFRIEAGEGKGAGTIEVSVNDEVGNTVTERVNFQLGETGLRLGYLESGTFFENEIKISPSGPISSEGEAILTLAIVEENGLPVQSAESISISSPCLDSGDATTEPANPVATVTGQVTVTYLANGCEGVDTVTARLIGSAAQAVGDVEVAAPSANGMLFVSATPELIVLRGTGGGAERPERSVVTFQAVNSANEPLEGVRVSFDLSTDVGELRLSPTSAVSDAEGLVTTIVSSGDVATGVRVIATADSGDTSNVSAVSDVITVSTGLPDQNSISLSVEGGFVVEEGMTKDGVTRNLIVRMADKFNNPVPDGTPAVFTTEYGAIESTCKTVGGACSVVWTSQAPRVPTLDDNQDLVVTINSPGYNCPSHNGSSGPCPDDLGPIRGGRSTILVTAIGEESFIDRNGNGIFDQDEAEDGLWSNLTEAFLDNSENGFYDPASQACNPDESSLNCRAGSEEIFIDYNNNGFFDADGDDIGNGYPDEGVLAVYNGLLCPLEGDGIWCTRELLNVRDSAVLILSADPNWAVSLYRGRTPVSSTTAGNTYTAYVADLFNNKPTAGSTVSITAGEPCTIEGKTSYEVPNTTAPGAFTIGFTQAGVVEYDSCAGPAPSTTGELTISLTPKDGGPEFSKGWICSANLVDTAPDPLCPTP
ncbi:hypothetical protein C0039_20280 [Pseudohalioglobus lutimaris]|uniref:Big-1 domain-containing protein n=2 Tax=Pseudohalioglobus lutimaris TaxID=1737061 RepID=A0A2N5WWY1_9GAMM|nr:hypothetical protein C0039_20280 [Pseudohalioglobus lutimaris]